MVHSGSVLIQSHCSHQPVLSSHSREILHRKKETQLGTIEEYAPPQEALQCNGDQNRAGGRVVI